MGILNEILTLLRPKRPGEGPPVPEQVHDILELQRKHIKRIVEDNLNMSEEEREKRAKLRESFKDFEVKLRKRTPSKIELMFYHPHTAYGRTPADLQTKTVVVKAGDETHARIVAHSTYGYDWNVVSVTEK